jgi:translation initiation factor IF-2
MKIHELAKELNITSKELLEKAGSLGIEAKAAQSNVSDADAEKLRGSFGAGKAEGGTETKIVKVTPKKNDPAEQEPKVVVKAANIKMPTAAPTTASGKKLPIGRPVSYEQNKATKAAAPIGKPVAYQENKAKPAIPVGKPVAYKSNEEREKEAAALKAAEAAKKAAEEKAAAEAAKKAAEEKASHRSPLDDEPMTLKIIKKASDEPKAAPKSAAKPAQARPEARDSSRGDAEKRPEPRPNRERKAAPEAPHSAAPEGGQRTNGGSRGGKRDDHGHGKEREHDKFSKLEGGGKGKGKGRPQDKQSLEKVDKPKKHIKKEKKVVEEPTINMEELPTGTVVITVPITVAGFCEQTKCSTATAIMALMKMGIMANINQNLDEDTVQILADEIGVSIVVGKVEEDDIEEGIEHFEDKEEDLKARPPIVTVMGHVDHGKTSLLDAIRKTNVTAGESGGITQHIGASEVTINGKKIVFLDTPGHEAFTAMRARGAHSTDIAVLVVAADDGVMPQTIESISHAKAAGVPIIVAINKMDKPGANPDRVKQELTDHGILVEDWGGDTISVPVSAKRGDGITDLLEMILLQAEVLELKANPNRLAMGTVIEARLDKAKGPVATLLVMNGTLKAGMSVVAGTCAGKIRAMTNFKGDSIGKAGPATAVEILGLDDVPEAGDEFNAVKDASVAREIAEKRRTKLREEVLARNASTTLEQLFSQIQEGEVKELNLIIKGDVQGSVGAIEASLEKLHNENVRVKIIHTGVGTVNESDVMLAGTAGAVIIGFNVRPSASVTAMAERDGIEIRTYRVIYDIIDDVEAAMKGMLDPEYKEVVLGSVEIRNTFKVPGVGIVGGAYVTDGKVVRNAQVRLVREGIVIHEGKISSLKRFKDDAKEVAQGFECGIGLENYNDIKEGDIIECFEMQEVERS